MQVVLVIIKYKWWGVPFAFLSMAIFRVPLWLNKKISFWALMGSGKNGSFDIRPDLLQWAVLTVQPQANQAEKHQLHSIFIKKWIKFFKCESAIYTLEPIEGFGVWNGKQVFGPLPRQSAYDGKIAVLTRATIRLSRLAEFWRNVPAVSSKIPGTGGLIQSYGIGEIPFIKQATFSIWEDKTAMKAFAYQATEHRQVIQKTRKRNWYREEMFVRFRVISESSLSSF